MNLLLPALDWMLAAGCCIILIGIPAQRCHGQAASHHQSNSDVLAMFDKQWFPTLGFYQASKNIVKHRVRVWLSGHAVEAEYPRHGEVSRLRPAQGRAVVRGSGGARTGDRSVVTHRPHSLYSLVGPNATMH